MSININLNDMENVKGILIEFMEWYNKDSNLIIEEEDISNFLIQSKYRPREPRAVNRNEQAKEVCRTSLEYHNQDIERFGHCRRCKSMLIRRQTD